MIKKISALFLIMCFLLTGCSESPRNDSSSGISSVSESQKQNKVDIDLSPLEGNSVFSEATDILSNADNYIGKTIRVKGYFSSSYDSHDDSRYFMILIGELPTEKGFEFIWDDNSHKYPDEYPKEKAEIIIEGELKSYKSEDHQYCYIATDEIQIL